MVEYHTSSTVGRVGTVDVHSRTTNPRRLPRAIVVVVQLCRVGPHSTDDGGLRMTPANEGEGRRERDPIAYLIPTTIEWCPARCST